MLDSISHIALVVNEPARTAALFHEQPERGQGFHDTRVVGDHHLAVLLFVMLCSLNLSSVRKEDAPSSDL